MNLKELRTTEKYAKMVVEKGIEKTLATWKEQLRREKSKSNDDIFPFISTYNTNNSNVIPKVREMYGNLQPSKTFVKISTNHKLTDCNGTRTHNYLVRKRTLNHLAKWLSVRL